MTDFEKRRWNGTLTKAEMVKAIIDDMKAKQSPYDNEDREKTWKPWLNRQTKQELEKIMTNRGI